jgi:hypothetical protein
MAHGSRLGSVVDLRETWLTESSAAAMGWGVGAAGAVFASGDRGSCGTEPHGSPPGAGIHTRYDT